MSNVKIILCLLVNEVLYEILEFLNSRQLTKLEWAGSHLHRLIAHRFGEKPFVRLNLELISKFLFFLQKALHKSQIKYFKFKF